MAQMGLTTHLPAPISPDLAQPLRLTRTLPRYVQKERGPLRGPLPETTLLLLLLDVRWLVGSRLLGLRLGRHRDLLARRRLGDREDEVPLVLLGRLVDHDRPAALGQLALEHEVGERILDVALDRPAQRAG